MAPGRRDAAQVLASDRIRMLNGGFTTISLAGATPMIDGAAIIGTDVMASNVCVIDAVLIP